MAAPTIADKGMFSTEPADALSNKEKQCHSDTDSDRLAEMGYTQEMTRKFSVWSILGVGFSLTNSWFGISVALITGIYSGGPVLLIYGIIAIGLVSTCVGISLSELSSALPNAGGQYFWAGELAPKSHARFASYLTGWCAWAGAIFSTTSTALAIGAAVVGCYQLSHPDFTPEPWHTLVAYQLINIFLFTFNCLGKLLPTISQATLYISLISFFVILVTVPASAPTHQDPSFVFATFLNATGWKSNGIAFIVGLINPNWAFGCLDCATHMAEEVPNPERNIPIALLGTVAIGFVTSWTYCISMFFSASDFDGLLNTATGVPILELFYQALGSRAGAIVLESMVIATGMGCLIAGHTWQSRLCWSFARDNGLPGSQYLGKINTNLDVPLAAHFTSCAIVAVLGCIYLGSSTAFNSMASACIVLLYISYSIPVIYLLAKGRSNLRTGPFWCGKLGLVANCVLLAWTLFTIVMYSLPTYMPAEASSMNYISAVYGVIALIIACDWFVRARHHYRVPITEIKDLKPDSLASSSSNP